MNKNYLLLKKKTIQNREKIKKLYFNPFVQQFGGCIKPLEAYEILENKKLSPVTIHVILKYLKTMANEEHIPYDEIEMKKVLKFIERRAKNIKRKALTEEEAKEVLEVTKKKFPRFYPEVLFGLHTGARKGEMYGLQWGDLITINKKCYIVIRRTYGETETKNGVSKKIPVSKDLKYALDKMFKRHYRLRGRPAREHRVFKKTKMDNFFKQLRENLSFNKPVSYHILRHTFATTLLNKNVIPKDVQQLMGHSSVSTTLDMYWTRPVEIDLDGYLPSISKTRRTDGQTGQKERVEKRIEQVIENEL